MELSTVYLTTKPSKMDDDNTYQSSFQGMMGKPSDQIEGRKKDVRRVKRSLGKINNFVCELCHKNI